MEKSTNNSVALRFLHLLLRWFDGLSEAEKLWIDFFESSSDFSLEFSRFQIGYYWKKRGIIYLSNYSGKSYASLALSDSEVTFLGEKRTQPSISFLCFFYSRCCIIKKVWCDIFLSSILQRVFHQGIQLFCCKFFSASNSSSVNYPSLMSSWLSIIIWSLYQRFQEDFQADFLNVLSTSEVFLLSWQFLVLLSRCFFATYFIYGLPC